MPEIVDPEVGASDLVAGSGEAPLPECVRENAGATEVGLSPDELDDLNRIAQTIGVRGDRYNPEHMAYVGR